MKPLFKILFVVGTRPNFMKIAPLLRECKNYPNIQPILLHTGQHYDASMSDIFFKQLEITQPEFILNAGEYTDSEKQKEYIANEIYERYKDVDLSMVVVVGDVNSTLGGAMAGEKLNVPVAHVEAGLRSYDERMPEESNRIAVDRLSKYLFVSEPSGFRNLKKEGMLKEAKAYLVGNVMIDTLIHSLPEIKKIDLLGKFSLKVNEFVILTLHRKENLEDMTIFNQLFRMILDISNEKKVLWPIHPRTKKFLVEKGLIAKVEQNPNITLVEPLGYFELISLVRKCLCVITDSGGIQDETTALKVPCLTIRRTTERPITTTVGSSVLIGENSTKLLRYFKKVVTNKYKKSKIPRYWDGRAAKRIMKKIDLMLKERLH